MEHRWGERIVVDIPVQVSVPPLIMGPGRVQNLSVSGAWISGKFELPPLARALVVFDLSVGGIHEPLPIACYVVRIRAEGIGVEWRELAPQIVSDLMLFATANPQAPDPRTQILEPPAAQISAAAKTYAG
jgi:PilZ domain